ncbi:MAG: Hdr-like menaquinol oxidoreductase cytochrome c subunit [Rhodocyclales bacterium]|nr:Hdr-like menaquinol oxidoreductase cytochrome c subunit [Rhodocyclales bacterium]
MARVLTLLASLVLALPFQVHAGEVAKPAVKIENPDTQCVAPAEEMRRNHMEVLQHQRNRTLRLGERGAKVSLNGCIECHASKTNGSVIGGKDNFCEACHAYAAVKLDCWDCHQPKAGYKAAAVAQPSGENK